jgi:hypothetical protein
VRSLHSKWHLLGELHNKNKDRLLPFQDSYDTHTNRVLSAGLKPVVR